MPKFSNKHYKAIAKVVRNVPICKPSEDFVIDITTMRLVVEKLSAMFKRDNPKFNRDKFLKACSWHE